VGITINKLSKVAEFYKALGDETRLAIVMMLAEQEMCVCEIIDKLGMSQPAVSHHLKILKHANLLRDTREGRWIYYSLSENVFEEVFQGKDMGIIKCFAEPIKQKLSETGRSQVRKDPELCEKLTTKHNK
jgi:ArsR family transcriptional regulator, arsenate/arsenite/antimonite-responsive transcriptional repressor